LNKIKKNFKSSHIWLPRLLNYVGVKSARCKNYKTFKNVKSLPFAILQHTIMKNEMTASLTFFTATKKTCSPAPFPDAGVGDLAALVQADDGQLETVGDGQLRARRDLDSIL
jgi:hypothetical protein